MLSNVLRDLSFLLALMTLTGATATPTGTTDDDNPCDVTCRAFGWGLIIMVVAGLLYCIRLCCCESASSNETVGAHEALLPLGVEGRISDGETLERGEGWSNAGCCPCSRL